jgi:hypothetical protein
VTTVALAAALAVLRIIRALLFAISTGALATAVMSWLFRSSGDASRAWAENVATLAIEVAAIGLVAAVVSWRRLPSMTQVRRRIAPAEPNHPVQIILLSGLAIGALLQLPLLLAWFNEDHALLLQLLGPRPDPLGLHLVPAAILYSLPTLAAVLLVLFATTSLSASLASRTLAYRFLTAGVILQTGFVAVHYLISRGVRDLSSAALRLMADGPPAETADAIAWLARHDAVARSMTPWLAALFVGYVTALVVARYLAPLAQPGAAAMVIPPAPLPTPAPPAPTPIAAAPPLIAASAEHFDERFYVLRLQAGWGLAGLMLGRSFIDYTIQTVPPSSRSEFSFSWATGLLRRAPAGPQILRLQAAERHDFLKRAYSVGDPVTGAVIGRFLPQGDDWQITDGHGQVMAEVLQSSASFNQTMYTITAGGEELCRLTAVMGATAASSEVQVEFLPARAQTFDRSLAIALAPIIEDRTRRARWT